MDLAIDKLIEKIKEMNNPTVIGLDPRYEMLPECVKSKYANNVDGICEAFLEFNKNLIDSVCDIIPAVKPQMAFYEIYGPQGIECFKKTCEYAKSKGMIVIADAKRGDIGSTAAGYSEAYIGKSDIAGDRRSMYEIDFLTVNPYLGSDGIKPFVKDCEENDKGIFVLVKTSNPSSGELQDLKLEDGKKVYEKMAEMVSMWGENLVGKYGYSSVAAVVGATYPIQIEELRKIMPHVFFLIPGYGAQGGKAEDLSKAFVNGIGGIVNSSRGLMCAYKSDKWKDKYSDETYKEATRAEAIRMRDELNLFINGEK